MILNWQAFLDVNMIFSALKMGLRFLYSARKKLKVCDLFISVQKVLAKKFSCEIYRHRISHTFKFYNRTLFTLRMA